jgi:hypothetical protein
MMAQLSAAAAATVGSAGPQRLATLDYMCTYMSIYQQQGEAAAEGFVRLLPPDELIDVVVVLHHGRQLLQQISEGAHPQ